MNNIIGHEQIRNFFNTIIENDSPHHAYCFVGPAHVGKKTIVRHISARFLNCSESKLIGCPDFFDIDREKDKKTGKTKKDISIAQIRELISYLSLSAFIKNGYKIAIIRDAEQLNINVANVLLKTLENPGKKTILFLTTQDNKSLPQTILSRCQTFYMSPVSSHQIENKLIEDGVGLTKARQIAELSRGLPGKAYAWTQDENALENHKKEISRFEGFIGKSFSDKLKAVEDLFGDKTDHIKTRAYISEVLGIWRLLIRDMWFAKINTSVEWTREQVLQVEKDILNAQELIEKNIHPRLLVETILLHIP